MRTQCMGCARLQDVNGMGACEIGKPVMGVKNRYCADFMPGRQPSMEGKKVCTRCGQAVPLDEFYRAPRYADGLDVYCKWCRKQMWMDRT